MKIEDKDGVRFICDFELWDRDNKCLKACGKDALYRTNVKQNKLSQHVCPEHSANMKRKHEIKPDDYVKSGR